jgi:hypothetical protein
VTSDGTWLPGEEELAWIESISAPRHPVFLELDGLLVATWTQ